MWLHEYITEETQDLLRVHDPRHGFIFEMFGQAPVQAYGEVDGCEFYFRARHNEWSCEVSDKDGQLPSDGIAGSDGFIRIGQYRNASDMPFREALKIIDRCMSEYLSDSTDEFSFDSERINDQDS